MALIALASIRNSIFFIFTNPLLECLSTVRSLILCWTSHDVDTSENNVVTSQPALIMLSQTYIYRIIGSWILSTDPQHRISQLMENQHYIITKIFLCILFPYYFLYPLRSVFCTWEKFFSVEKMKILQKNTLKKRVWKGSDPPPVWIFTHYFFFYLSKKWGLGGKKWNFYSYFYHFHRENPSQQFQWFDWCLFLRGDCWGRQSGGDKLVWWSIQTQLGWSEWELLHQILWKMEYDHLCSSYTHSELWLFFLDLFCNLFHLNHNNQIKQDQ